jgi:tRNA G18 (ribose-2'-O)-methylase SpoU
MKKELVIIAHNIRSAHNVGAFFRTADGAGVSKIYLTGYTQAHFDHKKDKFETKSQRSLGKTALGAVEFVEWEKREDIFALIEELKKQNFQILALEKNENSQNIFSFEPSLSCALILGNETRGIDQEILAKCDGVLEIPMRGRKESLNVSVAAGIAMYLVSNP